MHDTDLRALTLPLALLLATALPAQGGSAVYELTFQTTWSAQTHPVMFPPNPHFSPLIGGTHDGATGFWQLGGLASPGIEAMAELGATSLLTQEIHAAIAAGGADQVLAFGGLSTSPAARTVRFTVNAAYSRLTLVSMLAPSPDWFVGVSGLELRPQGQWIDSLTVPLRVHDAGTDSGTTYNAPNQNTSPQDPIDHVTTASGPFQGNPAPVGSYVLRRVTSTSVYGCGLNPAGSMSVSGQPALGGSVTLSLDDPGASMAAPATTVLLFSAGPDAAHPCGTPLAGFGLAAPGAAGELLVQLPALGVPGPAWTGGPVSRGIAIPNAGALAGTAVYVQGALVDASPRVGLTDAVELRIGGP